MQKTSLLLSAQAFLAEALRNQGAGRVQFAIVHAVTAAELVLKERLARINPALVLRNVDSKDPSREHTVALSSIPQRLTNLAAGLGSAEARLVTTFADWRNQIVHHMPSFDERQAQNQLPHLLDFIAAYLRNQLGTPLESFLPKDLFKTASRLLKDWEAAVRGAAARAAAEGSVLSDTCPLCGTVAVISARPKERAYCHLCKVLFYRYEACAECGRPTLSRFSPEVSDNFCDDCTANAGDRYAQMWFDIQRGK